MKFDLRAPCKHCPFRSDIPPFLLSGRVKDIEYELVEQQKTFTCHKTDRGPKADPQHCAGALILLEKIGRPNKLMRIAERCGVYDRTKLRMKAPVYDSFAEMRKAAARMKP